jgi:hypothetical protein
LVSASVNMVVDIDKYLHNQSDADDGAESDRDYDEFEICAHSAYV